MRGMNGLADGILLITLALLYGARYSNDSVISFLIPLVILAIFVCYISLCLLA